MHTKTGGIISFHLEQVYTRCTKTICLWIFVGSKPMFLAKTYARELEFSSESEVDAAKFIL